MPTETYAPNPEFQSAQGIEAATKQETQRYMAELQGNDFDKSNVFNWFIDAEDETGVGIEEDQPQVLQKITEKADIAAGKEPDEAKASAMRLYGRIAEAIVEQYELRNNGELPDGDKKQFKYNLAAFNDSIQNFARANPEVNVTELAQSLLETASPLLAREQNEYADEFIVSRIKGSRYEMALQDYAAAAGYEVVKSTPQQDRQGVDLTLHDPETGEVFEVDAKASIDSVAKANKDRPGNEKQVVQSGKRPGQGRMYVPAREDMFYRNGFFLKNEILEDEHMAAWLKANLKKLK